MVDAARLPPLGPASIFVVFPILCDNLSQILCLNISLVDFLCLSL